ncbi:CYFA0S10e04588g1_1 [Cyberlindnera fabianii]|uniref:Large ribosomal subunit protein mL44 n=1 Tax=Cyberlindnera fabianii TaxID=36022 RepID=A0A061B0H6_CYBFA|nr:CYFA0S10e04588g1_1 [Cyberlindnera fabianii]
MNTLQFQSTLTRPLVRFTQKAAFSTSTSLRQEAKRAVTEEEAIKSAPLVALHKRLNLPDSFTYSALARCLTCRSSKTPYTDNFGFNILGKNFLTYYTTEHLLALYPRLPVPVLNTAVASYISADSLTSVGKNLWGIEIDQGSALDKYLNEEPKEYSLGKLRFVPIDQTNESGVTKLTGKKGELDATHAYALAVRSVVGAFYTATKSEEETKKFIHDHILSRKLDVSKMFQFEQPTRELSRLCKRQGLEKPVARLLAENGRNSNSPIFVVAVFSGDQKLGESYGASLKEAKIRASVNALKNWYLYKPVNPTVPSDKNYKVSVIDEGIVIV